MKKQGSLNKIEEKKCCLDTAVAVKEIKSFLLTKLSKLQNAMKYIAFC